MRRIKAVEMEEETSRIVLKSIQERKIYQGDDYKRKRRLKEEINEFQIR